MNDAATTLPQLAIANGKPITTSLQVAATSGKRHTHVLRAIQNLDCSAEFRELNFGLTFRMVPGPRGSMRKEPYYNITRDGFSFLCMGFTGAHAARWKEAYIKAFNAMESALLGGHAPAARLACRRPAYMGQPWFVVVSQQGRLMQRRALARALEVHESTLSQVLNGTGKYGEGKASTEAIERRVVRVFCGPAYQPAQAAQLQLL